MSAGSTHGVWARPQVGERRPALELARARDGSPFRWTVPARQATWLAFLHGPDCDTCHAYLTALQQRAADLEARWDGRALAVIPAPPEKIGRLAELSGPGLTVLADPHGAARRRYGLGADELAGFLADRWGQIFEVIAAEEAGGLHGPDALEPWFRFLSTQCPECGVSDAPEEIERKKR